MVLVGGQVWRRGFPAPPSKDEVRRRAVADRNSSWVSSSGRTPSGMRRGADVHSESPTAAESTRPPNMYLGYNETSFCLMCRMASVVGRASSQSSVVVADRVFVSSPTELDESKESVSSNVWGCVPVSAATLTRFGAQCSAPPLFAGLRIVACTNWHATGVWWVREGVL